MLLYIAIGVILFVVIALALRGGVALLNRVYDYGVAAGKNLERYRALQEFCRDSWTVIHRTEGVCTVKEFMRDGVVVTVSDSFEGGHGEQILISRRLHASDPPCPFYAGGYERELTVKRYLLLSRKDDEYDET